MAGASAGAVIVLLREPGGRRDVLIRNLDVVIDGHRAGKVRRGRTAQFPVSPGPHRISVQVPQSSAVIEVNAQSGEVINLVCRYVGHWDPPGPDVIDDEPAMQLRRA